MRLINFNAIQLTPLISYNVCKGKSSITKSVFTEDKENGLKIPGFKLHKEGPDLFWCDGHVELCAGLLPFVIWKKENR